LTAEIVYEGRLPKTGGHFAGCFRAKVVGREDQYVRVQVTFPAATVLEGFRGRPLSNAEIETLLKCWGTDSIRRYLAEGKQLASKMSLTSKELPEVKARELLRRCGLD
jgi:hypothetical protein